MNKLPPTIIDFETEAIEARPHYPPRPVSVALHSDDAIPRFMAWGHPVGNNCTRDEARKVLLHEWKSGRDLIFYNAKFDVDVAETHLGLPRLPWHHYHDAMFLAFLANPHRTSLSLEKVALEELRRKSWKEGELLQWLSEHVPEVRRSRKRWGAYIAKAPAKLVAPRALGDAKATANLFARLMPRIEKNGMAKAYDRERRIMLPLLENERRGVRVNLRALASDVKFYEAALAEADTWLRKKLKAPGLDLDSGAELANALEEADAITDWVVTEKGNRSTAKQALADSLDDPRLLAVMLYRGALATYIRTFMRPWLVVASETNGWIHTNWNQVRQDFRGTDRGVGAKTGRLSSTPNFQNIQNPDRMGAILEKLAKSKVVLPSAVLRSRFTKTMGQRAIRLLPLPLLRDYIVPDDKDEIILVRDYNQQEFRILAHFEDGKLLEAYHADPHLDVHNYTRDKITELLGVVYDRRPVKDINFGLIYGMGLGKLAVKTDKSVSEVKDLKRAVLSVSDIKELNQELKALADTGDPIRTWGGRLYNCEKPAVVKGRLMTFEYRLLNTLVQGSAADNTKEAIARYSELPDRKRYGGRFLLTVHDETVLSAPKKHACQAMGALRDTMEGVEFDLPMLSDGKVGPTWGRLKKFDDERKQ
jgi:DNA polymerase I-like protein with 3'-5' exonuclease and polymerase domains